MLAVQGAVLELVLGLCHCASSLCCVHPSSWNHTGGAGALPIVHSYRLGDICGVNLDFSTRGSSECSREAPGRSALFDELMFCWDDVKCRKAPAVFWLSAVSSSWSRRPRWHCSIPFSQSVILEIVPKKRNRKRKVKFHTPIDQFNDSSRHDFRKKKETR